MPRPRARKTLALIEAPTDPTLESLPTWLRRGPGTWMLSLRIQPRASRNEIQGPLGDQLRIRLTAPPVDSAANRCLVEFLADRLGCSRSQVSLLRGQTSRQKVVAVTGLESGHILQRLQG